MNPIVILLLAIERDYCLDTGNYGWAKELQKIILEMDIDNITLAFYQVDVSFTERLLN